MKRIIVILLLNGIYSMQAAQQPHIAMTTGNNNEHVQYTQEERAAAEEIFKIIINIWSEMYPHEKVAKIEKILIQYPQIINYPNGNRDIGYYEGFTPLIIAAQYGEPDIVKLLIAKGANPNSKDYSGDTALHWAAYKGYTSVVNVLIAAGADINAKSNMNYTPLMEAVRQGNRNEPGHRLVVQQLIEAGANLDVQSDYSTTALMEAASEGLIDMVKLLIEAGADQNIKDKQGKTAADRAKVLGFKKQYEKALKEIEAERTGYQKRQKAAHQEIAQQIFPEEIEEPEITEIITDYAYNPKNTGDLPAKSLGGRSTKCIIQ